MLKPKLHKTEIINIDKLKLYPNNNRVHSDEQIDLAIESIKSYGITKNILVDKDKYIIAGEGIFMALKKMGYTEVPITIVSHLSQEQARKYRIMDNQVFNKGLTDYDAILKEMIELQMTKDDLAEIGLDIDEFDEAQFNELIGEFNDSIRDEIEYVEDDLEGQDQDEVGNADNIDVFVKKGQIWKLDNHILGCGNSADKEFVDKVFKDKRCMLLVTDPPYGVEYSDKNKLLNSNDGDNRIEDKINNDGAGEFKEIVIFGLNNVKKHLMFNASYYIFCALGNGIANDVMDILNETGFSLKHLLVWAKNNHVIGRCDYLYKHEPIVYGWLETHKFYGAGEQKTTVLNYDKPLSNNFHPTQKPIALIENLILNSSSNGDYIADIFGGAGSTLLACENTERNCIMIELDEKYCSTIINRWETITNKKAILLEE